MFTSQYYIWPTRDKCGLCEQVLMTKAVTKKQGLLSLQLCDNVLSVTMWLGKGTYCSPENLWTKRQGLEPCNVWGFKWWLVTIQSKNKLRYVHEIRPVYLYKKKWLLSNQISKHMYDGAE